MMDSKLNNRHKGKTYQFPKEHSPSDSEIYLSFLLISYAYILLYIDHCFRSLYSVQIWTLEILKEFVTHLLWKQWKAKSAIQYICTYTVYTYEPASIREFWLIILWRKDLLKELLMEEVIPNLDLGAR